MASCRLHSNSISSYHHCENVHTAFNLKNEPDTNNGGVVAAVSMVAVKWEVLVKTIFKNMSGSTGGVPDHA